MAMWKILLLSLAAVVAGLLVEVEEVDRATQRLAVAGTWFRADSGESEDGDDEDDSGSDVLAIMKTAERYGRAGLRGLPLRLLPEDAETLARVVSSLEMET